MIKKAVILFFLLAIISTILFIREIEVPYGRVEDNVILTIKEGEGLLEISKKLEERGVVRSSHLFFSYVLVSGKRTEIKAGTYLFSYPVNIFEVTEKLVLGDVYSKRITIIEGWNLNDIATYLEDNGFGTKEEFYALAGRPPYIEEGEIFQGYPGSMDNYFGFLSVKPRDVSLEGFLFPDTYYVPFDAEMEDVILLLLKNFERKVITHLPDEVDLFEIITVASLIEKEVITDKDKALVSGIIRKRIHIGMPIQIDATVVYLTGKRSTRVSIAETKIDSLYNTYVYAGLPKGPISNPGLSSIKAALNPTKSDYLYYLSKPTGETLFSKTLQEHNIAKNKYLK